LAFGHLANGFIVKQDMETFAADTDNAQNLGRLDIRFVRNGVDKIPKSALHDVYGTVERILGRFASDARLDEEGSDYAC